MSIGIVIFAHGSSVTSANDAVRSVAAAMAAAAGFELVETAFLEGRPTLADAVERLAARGAGKILVVPYFLTLGIHLQRDLPAMVDELARSHGELEIRVTPPLDGDPGLVRILVERAISGIADWK